MWHIPQANLFLTRSSEQFKQNEWPHGASTGQSNNYKHIEQVKTSSFTNPFIWADIFTFARFGGVLRISFVLMKSRITGDDRQSGVNFCLRGAAGLRVLFPITLSKNYINTDLQSKNFLIIITSTCFCWLDCYS